MIGRNISSINSLRYDKNHIMLFLIILIGLIVIFSYSMGNVSAANNSSIYVSTQGNDNYDGLNSTWNGTSGPKATIKNATKTVTSGGTIYIASGTYNENNINIYNNLNIIGDSQHITIICGTETGTILHNLGANVVISNLEFTEGFNLTSNGGAISNKGTLTVNNCTFIENYAYGYGGAISNDASNSAKNTLIVNNCVFIDNAACFGGAICNGLDNTTATITGSRFFNNNALPYSGFGGYGNSIYNNGLACIAIDNWWGSNTGPAPNDVYGGVSITPWLVLKLTASPNIIPNYGTSIITANLLYNSQGSLPMVL